MKFVRSDRPFKVVKEVKEIFNHIDNNRSGTIDLVEMKLILIEVGLDARNDMVKEVFWRIDDNNSRAIDFEEFLDMMTRTMILGDILTRLKAYFRNKMVSKGVCHMV